MGWSWQAVAGRRRDAGLALVAAAVPLLDVLLDDHLRATPTDAAVLVLIGLGAAALLARRTLPLAVLLVTAGCALVAFTLHYRTPTLTLPVMVALYTVGAEGSRRRSAVVAGVAATAAMVVSGIEGDGLGLDLLGHGLLAVAPVALGEGVRMQRSALAVLRERAELAARGREDAQRLRVEQERRRIARDLHDVVAHALTTITVQAGVAGHLLEENPAFAREALAEIGTAGRTALEELRGIVGVLRDPEAEIAPVSPGPGLGEIAQLVDAARREGVDVRFDVQGEAPDGVAPSVQVAAYRIVQEALTNVRRHAGPVVARVELRTDADAVRITVSNPLRREASGAGVPPGSGPTAGAGIVGMRERVLLLGGHLDAGPSQDGEFVVRACLPRRGRP